MSEREKEKREIGKELHVRGKCIIWHRTTDREREKIKSVCVCVWERERDREKIKSFCVCERDVHRERIKSVKMNKKCFFFFLLPSNECNGHFTHSA